MLRSLACFLFGAIALLSAAAHADTPPLVIANVTVIDVRTGALHAGQDVSVADGRIVSVAPALHRPPPAGALRVDGTGKFLIPGLWDCHVHLSWSTRSALPLFVALGITNVRDLGSSFSQIEGWRARIAAGELVGPRIMRVGPILNGRAFNVYQFVPGSVDGTRATVRLLAALGVDEIKVHRRMPRDWYRAAIDEARAQKLKVVGHIPIEIDPAEAAAAGQYMVEHTETLFEGTFAAQLTDDRLPAAMRQWLATDAPERLGAAFVKAGTWLDPTLSGYLEMADLYDPAVPRDPLYRYVAASQRRAWDELSRAHPNVPAQVALQHQHMDFLVDATARLHRAGVRMVAGTDAAAFRLVGFSLHRELADLVRAGFTPLEALQAATLNPAVAFDRITDHGTIEPGKLADLVLLDANPLARIENTQRIAAVVGGGHLYRRADLDALLREGERLAATN